MSSAPRRAAARRRDLGAPARWLRAPRGETIVKEKTHIQTYCSEKSNLRTWQKRVVVEIHLNDGAFAFGEYHDKPDARAMILDLVSEGAVKQLFLELADPPLLDFDVDHEAKNLGPYLRSKLGEKLKGDDVWEKAGTTFLKRIDKKHENPVGFAHLVECSVKAGVKVYFFDDAVGLYSQTGSSAIEARNKEMGKIFKKESGPKIPGAVILVGIDHLNVNYKKHCLQYLCGLGYWNFLDLS
jgi:hypothetical protein